MESSVHLAWRSFEKQGLAMLAGGAVLLISEDLDEILVLNDRVLVMYEGSLTEVDDREDVAEIGLRMAGE